MTVWPGQEVAYSYISDGPEYEAERRAIVAEIGEPVPFDEDPAEQEKATSSPENGWKRIT